MSHLVEKPTMWFQTRSDTSRPVQAQKRARIMKIRIKVEEELNYPSSENKGADQLRSYCEADLRLCFRQGRLLVFPRGGSYRRDLGLKTHLTDWRSPGSNLLPLVYKASDLTTVLQRLLPNFRVPYWLCLVHIALNFSK